MTSAPCSCWLAAPSRSLGDSNRGLEFGISFTEKVPVEPRSLRTTTRFIGSLGATYSGTSTRPHAGPAVSLG